MFTLLACSTPERWALLLINVTAVLHHSSICATAAGRAVRGPAQPSAKPAGTKPAAAVVEGSFSFLCLHAAVALTPLLPNAHSLLLTSGTLSPVAPLVAELGLGKSPQRQAPLPNSLGFATSPSNRTAHLPKQQHSGNAQSGVKPEVMTQAAVQCSSVQGITRADCAESVLQAPAAADTSAQEPATLTQMQCSVQPSDLIRSRKDLPADQQPDEPQIILVDHQAKAEKQAGSEHQQQQQHGQQQRKQNEQQQQQQDMRSQHARLHQGVELVSAPHHHTLPARLLPLTISMAPGLHGQLVKLDSAYERRQDTGAHLWLALLSSFAVLLLLACCTWQASPT